MAFITQIRRGFAKLDGRNALSLGVSATALVACALPTASWAQDAATADQQPAAIDQPETEQAIVVSGIRASL